MGRGVVGEAGFRGERVSSCRVEDGVGAAPGGKACTTVCNRKVSTAPLVVVDTGAGGGTKRRECRDKLVGAGSGTGVLGKDTTGSCEYKSRSQGVDVKLAHNVQVGRGGIG